MGCEYCREDRDGYIIPLDKNCHACLKYPNLLVIKFGKERRECIISFCPDVREGVVSMGVYIKGMEMPKACAFCNHIKPPKEE